MDHCLAGRLADGTEGLEVAENLFELAGQNREYRSVVDVGLARAPPCTEAGFISVVGEPHHDRRERQPKQVAQGARREIGDPGQTLKHLLLHPRAKKRYPAVEALWRLYRFYTWCLF